MNALPIEPVWLGLLVLFLVAVILFFLMVRSFCQGMVDVIEAFSVVSDELNAKHKRRLDVQMLGAKERDCDQKQAAETGLADPAVTLQEGDGAASSRPPTAPAD